jgi:membrane-bound serine protease (ClpP class)
VETAVIVALYLCGLAAMLVEMFIPGVVVGVMGFLAVMGSIIYAVSVGHYWTAGILMLATLALIPVFFLVWKNVIARFFAITEEQRGYRPSVTITDDLLGQQGVAVTPLRPSGIARLRDRRYDVVTEGEMIEKGVPVVVIDVTGNRVVVRKV